LAAIENGIDWIWIHHSLTYMWDGNFGAVTPLVLINVHDKNSKVYLKSSICKPDVIKMQWCVIGGTGKYSSVTSEIEQYIINIYFYCFFKGKAGLMLDNYCKMSYQQ